MEVHSSPVQLVLQLAIILFTAKLFAFVFSRYLKLPRVLGEIVAGICIGPFALGAFPILTDGPLFSIPVDGLTISPEIGAFVTIASVILMFVAGLETDAKQFIRLSGIASLIALGGFILSFFAGAFITMMFFAEVTSIFHPTALIWGVIATTTSVSITARILSDENKIATPEASTILASAVLDDVMGIIVLAVIIGAIRSDSKSLNAMTILSVAGRAFGFWLIMSIVGFFVAPLFIKWLKRFQSFEIIAGLTFGVALLLAGISESLGLAMIIGAYITGLSLSQTDISETLQEYLQGIFQIIVPIFFVNMGMLIDFRKMEGRIIGFGLVYSVLSIIAKVLGSGSFALLTGFNFRGALRIGWGMVPRGEVALIVAGIALSFGAISQNMFGTVLILLLFSSIVAPPVLSRLFKGASGYRKKLQSEAESCRISLSMPSPEIVQYIVDRLVNSFHLEEYFVTRVHRTTTMYQIKKDDCLIVLQWSDTELSLTTHKKYEQLVRLVLSEVLLELRDIVESLQKSQSTQSLSSGLLGKMFQGD